MVEHRTCHSDTYQFGMKISFFIHNIVYCNFQYVCNVYLATATSKQFSKCMCCGRSNRCYSKISHTF